jgi:predicted ATPase
LLRACPRLRILATSREALGVPGEVIWHVPSLAFPALRVPAARPSPIDLAGLARLAAPQLFVDRARQRRADFALSADNAAAIVEICQRLDGIPLAIELAAARIGVLTVEQIAARLDDALGTLVGRQRAGPTRQQTMRATLDWSYTLLNDAEKELFVALAACGGGWTLDAAEAIWGEKTVGGPTTLDLLEGLNDKSLVIAEQRGESVRYRMLEVVRQYAAERLAHDPTEHRLRRQRHAAHFLALAEAIEPTLIGSGLGVALGTLEREHDNIRAALRWSLAEATRTGTPPELALRLSGALTRFWRMQGHINEGYRWATTLLHAASSHAGDLPPAVLAKTSDGVGVLALLQGDEEAARAALREGITLWRVAGDRDRMARSMVNLGFAEASAGDFAVATRLLDECVAIFRSLGDLGTVAITLDSLGFTLLLSGDRERARLILAEAIAIARSLATTGCLASALINLGNTLIEDGDVAGALARQRESLTITHGEGTTLGILWALEGIAHAVAALAPRVARAVRLYGAAEVLRDEIGYRRLPASRAFHERHIAAARARLDPAAFGAAWDAGRRLPLEAAIAEAFALADDCLAELAAPASLADHAGR